MFLKSEAADAVKKVESEQQAYERAVKCLEETCELRYELCCSIRDVVRLRYEKLLKTIAHVAKRDTTGKIEALQNAVYEVDVEFVNTIDSFNKEIDSVTKTYNSYSVAGAVAKAALTPVISTMLALNVGGLIGYAGTALGLRTAAGITAAVAAEYGIGGAVVTTLGLSNPIGWTFMAAGAVWSGFSYRNKNKETIEKAQTASKEIHNAIFKINTADKKILEAVMLNEKRVNNVIEDIDHLCNFLRIEGLNTESLRECQIVIETVKQLAHYMSERVTL